MYPCIAGIAIGYLIIHISLFINKKWRKSLLFGAILLIISFLFLFTGLDIATDKMQEFNEKQAFIYNYIPANDAAKAVILHETINLNDWLYEAQYITAEYPLITFYPREILEWQPIEYMDYLEE